MRIFFPTTYRLFAILILFIAMLSIIGCSDDSNSDTDGDNDTSTDGDNEATTDGDEDNSADGDNENPVDGDNENMPDGDNDQETENSATEPLARKTTTLIEVAEPIWLVPGASENETGTIKDDDGAENPGETIASITEKFMTDQNGTLVAAKYGDLDGDNKLELVVLSIYREKEENYIGFDWLQATIIDDKDANFAVIGTLTKDKFDFTSLNQDEESVILADLEIGNIDDDNNDEIVIAAGCGKISTQNGTYKTSRKSILFIFDDLKNNLSVLAKDAETFAETKTLQVDLGDFDSDDKDEIVAIGVIDKSPKAWVFDDYDNQFEELHTWRDIEDNYVFREYVYNPNVTAGDFDGDGVDEILFGGLPSSFCRFQTMVYDDALNNFEFLENKKFDDCGSVSYNETAIPKLESGDLTGDGADEAIIAIHDNYAGQNRSWRLFYFMVNKDDSEPIDYNSTENDFKAAPLDKYNPNYMYISVADTDRDMKDEIYLVYTDTQISESSLPNQIETTYSFIGKRYELTEEKVEKTDDWKWDISDPQPALIALGDIDSDSVVARYTDEKWQAMSEPRIVVAMAMPPAWSDIPQANSTNTWIGYGQVKESSTTESNEINMSASVTLTAEGGDPFGIVEVEASTSLKKEITKTQTKSRTFSTGIKHICGWTDDELDNFVVFASTEYTRYKYEIISHEDSSKIGTFFTVDVPGTTNVFKKTVAAFNNQNDDYPDIGEETFKHTVGKPDTYPTVDDKNNMLDTENDGFTGWETKLHTVGETSGGGSEVFISLSKEQATSEARTLGVEVSAGFSVGGIGTEVSVGLSETNIYEISVGESTEYVGSVGDIPSTYYNDYSYEYGMFVYNFIREDGAKYQVINWYVK